MLIEVGMHKFPKSPINSTKINIEQDFSTQWLSFGPKILINFKFNVKIPFFNIFVNVYLDKGHNQTVSRHSGPDSVSYSQFIYLVV